MDKLDGKNSSPSQGGEDESQRQAFEKKYLLEQEVVKMQQTKVELQRKITELEKKKEK